MEEKLISLKNEGNALFSQGDYLQAYLKFNNAVVLLEDDIQKKEYSQLLSALYSNLSSCSFNLNNYSRAINQADKCIEINSNWYKGYFRKANAYLKLNNIENFKILIKKALEFCKSDLERMEIEKFIEKTKILPLKKYKKNLFYNIYEDKNSENEFEESVQNQYDWLMSQFIKPSEDDAFRSLAEYHEVTEDELSNKSAECWIRYGEKYGCGDSPDLLDILREYLKENNPELKQSLLIKINKYIY
jgi:tetratricopeptide (TPR) repeat protein